MCGTGVGEKANFSNHLLLASAKPDMFVSSSMCLSTSFMSSGNDAKVSKRNWCFLKTSNEQLKPARPSEQGVFE